MGEIKRGFAPFYGEDAKVLVLGSFPSVKSRQTDFFYGNPQNAFWRIVSSHFGEQTPRTLAEKQEFLLRRKIALWDVVESCEIVGSSDAAIKNFTVADVGGLVQKLNVPMILLNGGKAARIYERYFKNLPVTYVKLPSTSPANTKRNEELWYDALRAALG